MAHQPSRRMSGQESSSEMTSITLSDRNLAKKLVRRELGKIAMVPLGCKAFNLRLQRPDDNWIALIFSNNFKLLSQMVPMEILRLYLK
jgi:hypothetical protein